MYHFRKTRKQYDQLNSQDKHLDGCTFCAPENSQRAVEERGTVYVIPNRVQYDVFEGVRVIDHLMVIPHAHRESLSEFTDQEKLDMLSVSARYEAKGYHIFARGVDTATRSVAHQHTHLILTQHSRPKLFIYIHRIKLLVHK